MPGKQARGFTLIELIVTVSILAVLIAIVVVALNPAEQLQRARDAKRVADLDAIKTALNLYAAQATSTINMSGETAGNENKKCAGLTAGDTWWVNAGSAPVSTPAGFSLVTSSVQTVGATGWVPARLDQTPGGSPLSVLPLDPTTGGGTGNTYYYSYSCRESTKAFELTARLESTYFQTDLNMDGTDGGDSSSTYEVGSDLTIVGGGY